jgi:hypothetical protein
MSETVSDNERILRYFSSQILECFSSSSDRKVPLLMKRWRVASTAVVYFRKFYGVHQLRAYDPRLVMLCSIFLAGKTEEQPVSFAELQAITTKFNETALLNGEIKLLESLQFDLKIYHPHNCVNAIIADFKLFCFNHLRVSSEENITVNDESNQGTTPEALMKSTQLFSILGTKWLKKSELVVHSLQLTSAIVEYSALSLALVALQMSFDACDPLSPVEGESVGAWPVSFGAYLLEKFDTSTGTGGGIDLPPGGTETYEVLREQMQQVERRFYYSELNGGTDGSTVQERVAAVTDSIGWDELKTSFSRLKATGCEYK